MLGRNQIGMSDDQLRNEREARDQLIAASLAFMKAIQNVNYASALVKIDEQSFRDWCHDELPTTLSWNEKIAEARS